MPNVISFPLDKSDMEMDGIIREKFKRAEEKAGRKKAELSTDEEADEKIRKSIDAPCRCGKSCLRNLKTSPNNYEQAISIVKAGRCEALQKGFNTLAQQKDAIRSKFKKTITSTDKHERYTHNFSVGEGESEVNNVCREAFARFHGVTVHAVDALSKECKEGKIRIVDYIQSNSYNSLFYILLANRCGKFITQV